MSDYRTCEAGLQLAIFEIQANRGYLRTPGFNVHRDSSKSRLIRVALSSYFSHSFLARRRIIGEILRQF